MYEINHMPKVIDLGYVGENEFRVIEINMRPWLNILPYGVASIIHIRPGETEADAYITGATMTDSVLRWTITAADLGTEEGYGEAQIWLETPSQRGKSVKVQTYVRGAVSDASSEVPEAQESWMEQMTALKEATVTAAASAAEDAEKAEAAVSHNPRIGSGGTWEVWDAENEQYVDTEVSATGPSGADGVDGAPGEKGDKGDKGDTGVKGDKGDPGGSYTIRVLDCAEIDATGNTHYVSPTAAGAYVEYGFVLTEDAGTFNDGDILLLRAGDDLVMPTEESPKNVTLVVWEKEVRVGPDRMWPVYNGYKVPQGDSLIKDGMIGMLRFRAKRTGDLGFTGSNGFELISF